jgi:hypothetical protein
LAPASSSTGLSTTGVPAGSDSPHASATTTISGTPAAHPSGTRKS